MSVNPEPKVGMSHVDDLVSCPRLLESLYLGSWAIIYAFYVGSKDHLCVSMHLCYSWIFM